MKLLRLAIPVALLSLVVACGSNNTTTSPPPAAAPTSAPATSSGPTSSSESSSSAGGQTLTGTLAPNDGFSIFLKDATGAAVTTLKAGSYTVIIKDTSTQHNLHLKGPGVDEKTTVPELKEITWQVTLTAGLYTFVCDPHGNMKIDITVT